MATLANGKTEQRDPALHSQTKQSKVERYGWQLLDTKGEFRWVNKKELCFDPAYQRNPTFGKVKAIAGKWSWIACGVLIVSWRGGKLYVVDGNHRLEAALMRTDIDDMPCMVHSLADVSEEAKAFILANKNRKPMSSAESFKALCTAGDPDAIHLLGLIEGAGYHVVATGTSTHGVKCVATLLWLLQSNREVFMATWPLVMEITKPRCVNERVFESVNFIEARLRATDGPSLLSPPWRDRVVRLGDEGIKEAAAKASAFYARGGSRIWSIGVVNALNRGVRNKLAPGIGEVGEAETKGGDQ